MKINNKCRMIFSANQKTTVLLFLFVLFIISLTGIAPGRATESDSLREITLEEARAMALENNNELQIARTSMEEARLVLDNLNENIKELEGQEEEVTDYLENQKLLRDELLEETEELARQEEELLEELEVLYNELEEADNFEDFQEIMLDIQSLQQELIEIQTELAPLRAELVQVESSIQAAQLTYDNFDLILEELQRQLDDAQQTLDSAEETLLIQEELLLFGVEALFAVNIIMQEQFPLQAEGADYINKLIKKEIIKEESGYSTELEIMELESQLRDIDRAGDALERQYNEILDQLCLLIGLRPGTDFIAVPFLPQSVEIVELKESIDTALSEGELIELRRDSLAEQQQILAELEEELGDEEGFEDSFVYQQALINVELAEQQLKQAEDQTCTEVRRTYYALKEAENELYRSYDALQEAKIQEEALVAAYESGYSTALESAAGPLGILRQEAEMLTAEYQYHIALAEFKLVVSGYIISDTAGPGITDQGSFSSEPVVLDF